MSQRFEEFEINHIPRGENTIADLLACLTSTKDTRLNKTIIQETLEMPSTEVEEVITLKEAKGWMMPIIRYLTQNVLSEEEREAKHIRRISVRYLIMVDQLYKMGRSSPMLSCISEEDSIFVMKEIH